MPTELEELLLLLGHLAEEREAIPFSRLYLLSDLAGEELTEFRSAWSAFSADRRRRLLRALAELAEASFEVNFDAIFRHCLDDPDEEVRETAVDGLWENEEVSLMGRLLTMLRTDPSPRVRAAAASGLGRYVLAGELDELDPPIQARIITDLLTTFHLAGESIEVRRRAVESLAYACSPEVTDLLEMAYYDDDEQMRQSAVVGMGRSCDRRWTGILLSELESDSAPMRYEAAVACGELGLKAALAGLARLLDDPDRQIREASIWAVGQIGGPDARNLLLDAYDQADESTRLALDEALAEQALATGDLDFMLYDLDAFLGDELLDDDEFYDLWSGDDEDEEKPDDGDW